MLFAHLSAKTVENALSSQRKSCLYYLLSTGRRRNNFLLMSYFFLKQALTTQVVTQMVKQITLKSLNLTAYLNWPGNTAVTRHEGPYDETVTPPVLGLCIEETKRRNRSSVPILTHASIITNNGCSATQKT